MCNALCIVCYLFVVLTHRNGVCLCDYPYNSTSFWIRNNASRVNNISLSTSLQNKPLENNTIIYKAISFHRGAASLRVL
uniref:Secreted protein n=1 Tax=Lepeophtheirus salmonis TaxID=72036 RepID=A0A0K2UHG9_LEPSM